MPYSIAVSLPSPTRAWQIKQILFAEPMLTTLKKVLLIITSQGSICIKAILTATVQPPREYDTTCEVAHD